MEIRKMIRTHMAKVLRMLHLTKPQVLVHSMGKVGSSAIYYAVVETNRFNTFHTHQLNLDSVRAFQRTSGKEAGHIQHSLRFLSSPSAPVKFVTAVRDPMSRNISAFFENLADFGLSAEGSFCVDRAIRLFLEEYSHHVPIRWFDEQVKKPLGVDLLAGNPGDPFRFSYDRFDVLVLRAEDPNSERQAALRQFLGCPKLQLERLNEGKNKAYASWYSEFKIQFKPSSEMLDSLYNAPYVCRFYSATEREKMKNQWC